VRNLCSVIVEKLLSSSAIQEIIPHLTESKGSLPCSQKLATCPDPFVERREEKKAENCFVKFQFSGILRPVDC
jgi:hypothetical protein